MVRPTIRRTTMGRRLASPSAWLACLALAACTFSAASDGADREADDSLPAQGRPVASDSVPAAIVGQAPPPRGTALHYFPRDSATTGYLVVPADSGPHSAVILIHEWNGLDDRVRQVADALADHGYVALAADLYSGRTGSDRDENMALVQETHAHPETVVANLDAAQELLRARPDATGRVATIGWCFGGGIALSYAIGGRAHEGTAIFYGSLVTDPAELERIHHPIYGTFGELDSGIPPDEVARFVDALRAAGIENDVHVYDGVGHGFWLWVDRDPDHRLAPAADAWRRLQTFLRRTLGEG